MKRTILLVLVSFMLFSVAGCKTLNEIINSNAEDDSFTGDELSLDSEQAYLLRTWYHNAVVSEDVGDYSAAIRYYSKVVEYFPQTKKAAIAQKKINVLDQSGKH